MACEPSFKKVKGFAAAHLADDDAVRRHAKDLVQAVCHRKRSCCTHLDFVLCLALKFRRILDDDDAVIIFRDFSKDGIEKRRLATLRAACRDDVLLLLDGFLDDVPLVLRHDSLLNVVVESEDGFWMLADVEGRLGNDVREISFETAFRKIGIRRDICIEAGFLKVDDLVGERSDVVDDLLAFRTCEHGLCRDTPFSQAVDADESILVAINLKDSLVLEIWHNFLHATDKGAEGNIVAIVLGLRHVKKLLSDG